MGTPLLLSLFACGGPGDATSQYLDQLQPLLQENGLLAERVLMLAADVYNESARAEQIADGWSRGVVPISEHLANQSSFVAPPAEYAQAHAELIQIWTDRSMAYRDLSEAIRTGDTAAWNSARDLAGQVKLREEAWFNKLNGQLQPSGILVDPYP